MKHLVLVLSMAISACSCAGKSTKAEIPPPPTLDGGIRLVNKRGIGSACPVDGMVLTAAHVANAFLPFPAGQENKDPLMWSDGLGHYGVMDVKAFDPARDLAELVPVLGDVPVYFKAAPGFMPEGTPAYWFDYNYAGKEAALGPALRQSVIVRTVAGHYVIQDAPRPGSSGGCLFNQEGLVVGVIIWGMRMDSGEVVGVAVATPGGY